MGRPFGCGSNYLDGWCNIDGFPAEDTDTHRGNQPIAPDLWADIMNIPAKDNSVDIIMTQHVVEHFYRHQAIQLFREFRRILKPGGIVITEMPDLSRIILLFRAMPFAPRYNKSMGANRDMIKSQLYGASWEENESGYPYHKYVWERAEFCEMLDKLGYNILLQSGATHSHVPFRDMVVISQKTPEIDNPWLDRLVVSHVSSYGSFRQRVVAQVKSLARLTRMALSP